MGNRIRIWMQTFSIVANVASIFGLLLTAFGTSSVNPYFFIVIIAFTTLVIMLLLAYGRDDRIHEQIIQEMNQRFVNLTVEYIDGLPDTIQELNDEIIDLRQRIDALENI